MINVSIAGIGGQGSVLAAKILAQAAESKGWQVRTAETTGMAQRGGDVMSHIRMGNLGETVYSPLPAKGSVDLLIALEPGEAARALPLLKKGGLLVTATTGISPTLVDFNAPVYRPEVLLDEMKAAGVNMVTVDDASLCAALGDTKCLNIMMLAYAILVVNKRPVGEGNALRGELSLEAIREALPLCVKDKFIRLNTKAINLVEKRVR